MALQKQSIPINFARGLDTKTDPKQVEVGRFLSLQNTIFNKGGLLQKRNGFGALTSLPNDSATFLTTFNGNLTAISNTISAFSKSSGLWVTKGNIQPLSLNTLPLIRSNTNQSQVDIAISSNGYICTVYTDQNPGNLSQSVYKYVVADATTGQNIIEPTVIPAVSGGTVTGSPRVFTLGNRFIILFTNVISSTSHLQYISINTLNPSNVTTPVDVAATYEAAATLAFDGVVVENQLFIAYSTNASSVQSVDVVSLSTTLSLSAPVVFAGLKATMVSVTSDTTNSNNPIIYISIYNSATSTGFTAAVNFQLNVVLNPVEIITSGTVLNLTSAAQNGVCTIYYEVSNAYSYDSAINTNFINSVSVIFPTFTFNGTYNSGSTSITANSSTGLVNGMFLFDETTPTNIPANTTFTVSGTTLTLSNATTGSSPYVFTCSTTITVSAGATYTNNSHTFTVLSSVTAGHTLICSGTGAPTATGTLTRSGGTGTTPITFTANVHNADVMQPVRVTSTSTIVRSVGLASKAFTINGTQYFLAVYDDSSTTVPGIQQTYFLIDGSDSTQTAPIVVGKLAYQNAGGYLTTGLPNAIVSGNSVSVPYLFKDLIQTVNKVTNNADGTAVSAVYTQTGINYATFTLGTQQFDTVEIGSALHLSGGFLWMYDGYLPVEHNFFLYPSSVEGFGSSIGGAMPAQKYFYQAIYEWTDNQGNAHQSAPSVPTLVDLSQAANTVTFSSVFTSGVSAIVVSNTDGLFVGQTLTDSTTGGNITVGTTITSIDTLTNTLGLSVPTAGASAATPGDTLVAATAPISFTAAFVTGQTQLLVSSTTGLVVGQYLTDTTTSANLQANTYITNINTTTGIVTINFPVTATATSDTIQTTSQCSVTIDIPTLRLTYKTANPVKIVLYRWSTAQQQYFQVTSINTPLLNSLSADSIGFTDTFSDAQILGNNLIYTSGNVVEDVNAPASNIMTLWNTRLFLLDAEDQNLIWFSKQVIENTPVEMSDLLTLYVAPTIGASGSTGPVTALSAMDSNLIIFKKDAIYYVTGQGPDNTGSNNNFTDPIFITSVVGCTNQQSIVFTPAGLMFQSDKGIWLLDRSLGTSYIGAAVENFTLGNTVLSAVIVPATNQVRFTLSSGITLMYDYYYQQWGTFVNIPAISSCVYNDLHTYLNASGQVFQETPNLYLDGTQPVLMQFTTAWIKAAGIQGWQRTYWCEMLGSYISPHKLTVGVAYDYNPAIIQQAPIAPDNFTPVWGGNPAWGLPTTQNWGGPGPEEPWQINFKRQQCQSFQLTFTEQFDSTFGVPAGAGLTISSLNLTIGVKKGYARNIPATHRTG